MRTFKGLKHMNNGDTLAVNAEQQMHLTIITDQGNIEG